MARQKIRASLEERFHIKVSPEPNTGCWLWTGATKELGYGVIGRGRRGQGTEKAHRVSWRLHYGDIPDGQCVCHRCDVPSCVNPEHLFLGSLGDNARDCVAKGRNFVPNNRGERAKWAKLTSADVAEIRKRAITGVAYAKRYGVSKSAIYQIWAGQNWAH
jgi:hypothetical protein